MLCEKSAYPCANDFDPGQPAQGNPGLEYWLFLNFLQHNRPTDLIIQSIVLLHGFLWICDNLTLSQTTPGFYLSAEKVS